MTKAYSVPKTVYSLAVMGTYLDLINQDLQPTSDPLKILYAQRIGFFPTMTVLNGREIIDRVNMDLGASHIPLTQFLNGLIKNRLLVQAETMARNIEARYVAWYQVSRKRDKKLTDTLLNNRDSVYLPNATTLAVISKLITNTINGSYLKATPGDGSPYDVCMTEVQYEFATLCNTTGTLAPAPFSSSRFFPLLTSLLSVLKAAVDIPEEPYRYRMLPIVRIIYILCRMFNGDIKDSNYDSIFTGESCDSGLFISDTTLAIMSGCTSDVIRTLGIQEPAPISLKGQFYLTACDGFVGDSLILDKA